MSAAAAMIETDIKRIIAYSTVSQIGFIFLGLSIDTRVGIAGGLLFILMHGLAKGGLFLCAGIVEQKTHVKDITKLGGLASVMPVTAICFIFCSFSIMGIPPFGGFFSKYMVFKGTIDAGQTAIALTFMIGAIMTIIYLLRLFVLTFLGPTQLKGDMNHYREGSATMVWSVAFLAAASLIAGIFVAWPAELVNSTINQMMGIVG